MTIYVQYHNVDRNRLLLAEPPFSSTRLAIHTSRPSVQKAEGRVFLIAGIGQPRHFFLWQTFEIESIQKNGNGLFKAGGTGWQLAPPVELRGKRFEEFKVTCANFVGFRRIDELPFTRTLLRLADMHRPPGKSTSIVKFFKRIDGLLDEDGPDRKSIRTALGHYEPVRALSVRQPHAEAIMRGTKKVEYRKSPTHLRGRVLIYAALGRDSPDAEAKWMKKHRINDVSCDDLPRGVLVGSVELFDCDGGNWKLREPNRAKKLMSPKKQPQPVWFYPF